MLRHRRPALVINAAVPVHLKVLRLMSLGGHSVIEGVRHADAFDRALLDPVDEDRLRQARHFQDGGRDVDHVMELAANFSLGLDSPGPVHDRAVAGAAPVRGHLLGPLIGRIHGMRPAHRIVVVRFDPAELVEVGVQELGRFQVVEAGNRHHLVVGALERSLGRGAVVPDDHVDQRVLQNSKVLERVNQPPDLVVRVLEKTGIHLHLSGEYRLQVVRHVIPGRDFGMALGEPAVRRDNTEFLLPGERLLAHVVPALVELALILVGPFPGHVMRRVRGARREVRKERLVGHERLLLADPLDCFVGHVLGEVIALFGGLFRLDGSGAFINGGVVLVGLAADEAVEVLEPPAAGGPGIERTHGTRLPDRHLMALAELRRRVTVELQRPGDRRDGVGHERALARRRRREFGDGAHAGRVVVAAGQERLPGGRAQRGGVEPVVLEAGGRQFLKVRRPARAAKRAARAKAHVVNQNDQDVGRARGRPQVPDRWVLCVRILGVEGGQAHVRLIRDGQHGSLRLVLLVHSQYPFPTAHCRAMAARMVVASSLISSPLTSTVAP